MSGRIAAAFARAAAQGRAAFVPYLTAGFPDAERSFAAAKVLAKHADVLEIGLPYSDPLGDGPTIQRSSETALAAGATTAATFALVQRVRSESDVPIALMTYYNPVYGYRDGGEAAFVAKAKGAGVDALILPDLPPDEGGDLIAAARASDLDTVFLVAPTSTEGRLARVTRDCRGFVYAVSVTGVTGARQSVPEEVGALVARTRAAGGLPVAVGFGVGDAESAARIAAVADGVVVGSALVERVAQLGSAEDAEGLARLDAFAGGLAAATVR